MALYPLLFLSVALRLRNGNPVSLESARFSMHLSPASSFPTVSELLWVIRGSVREDNECNPCHHWI